MAKQIIVTTCGECPYNYYIGTDTTTGKSTVSCQKLFGGPWCGCMNYNRGLYNNAVYEDDIRSDCPLEDVI